MLSSNQGLRGGCYGWELLRSIYGATYEEPPTIKRYLLGLRLAARV